jgi:hypothetical protein
MKNPIKTWLQKRQQKKASKQNIAWLKSVAQQHQWLDQLRTAGLLQWDVVQRRLFIEADLAVLFLQSADRWTAFIHNTYQWLYFLECQRRTEDYMHQEELKAVREAMAEGQRDKEGHGDRNVASDLNHVPVPTVLKREDIDRIRRNRRAEIMQSDVPVPKVEGFEFFIVRSDAVSTAADQATGRLIAVGHYDPANDGMEIASWDEIQPLLQPQK